MSAGLHIVRLVLDRRELARVAVRHGLSRSVDEGYLLHAGLSQLFATSSERAKVPFHTFAVDDTLKEAAEHPELVYLLAYSDLDEAGLNARMGPARASLVRKCASRPLHPVPAGTRAVFRLRACPIKRYGKDSKQFREEKKKQGAIEIDAYVAACIQAGPGVVVDRSLVYRNWLERQLDARPGARLVDVEVASFHRDRLSRQTQGEERRGHGCERPDVTFAGALEVTDAPAFDELLRRGVGRHRAFGFGMLRLRSS